MAPTSLFTFFNGIAPLSVETWLAVSPLFHQKLLHKHAYFVEAGPVADTFAFMSEGVIRVFYRTADGAEYNKHFFSPPNDWRLFVFGDGATQPDLLAGYDKLHDLGSRLRPIQRMLRQLS